MFSPERHGLLQPEDLRDVASAALGRPVGDAALTSMEPIAYDPFLPGRGVWLALGAAGVAGTRVSWVAVVKRTTGPGLLAARRELAAYRSVASGSPRQRDRLGAPRLLAATASEDAVELWLERLVDRHAGAWPVAVFAAAARHVAAWDAQWVTDPLPAGFAGERAWAAVHGQPGRVGEALAALDGLASERGAGDAMAAIGDPGFRRTRALVEGTAARIEALDQLPGSVLHHDLVRSNLFALEDGGTAAIDWEHVGPGPLGVDLVPLVLGSIRRGEASGADLPALERSVLGAYRGGLMDAGVDGQAAVDDAFELAVGLRWHVVLGTIRALLDPGMHRIRGGRPGEPRAESLRHLVAVGRRILGT